VSAAADHDVDVLVGGGAEHAVVKAAVEVVLGGL
jgi:hypothetical protein